MAVPETDLTDHLAAASLGLTVGTNLLEGPLREPDGTYITAPTVFVQSTGIGRIDPYLGGPTAPDYSTELVRVIVRGDRNGYTAARTLALSIITATHKATLSGYVKVLSTQAMPFSFEDTEGRPVLTINFSLQWKVLRGTP